MKKLTRMNLDELAEKMQGVSVSEQQNFIGGSFYFDDSGNFVGKYGNGNDIIIANSILHSGISFSIVSPETMASVLQRLAKRLVFLEISKCTMKIESMQFMIMDKYPSITGAI